MFVIQLNKTLDRNEGYMMRTLRAFPLPLTDDSIDQLTRWSFNFRILIITYVHYVALKTLNGNIYRLQWFHWISSSKKRWLILCQSLPVVYRFFFFGQPLTYICVRESSLKKNPCVHVVSLYCWLVENECVRWKYVIWYFNL